MSVAVPLGDLNAKYGFNALIEFLQDPQKVRPAGRMPNLNLSADDARDVASFFVQDGKQQPELQIPVNLRYAVYHGHWPKVPDFSKLKIEKSGTVAGFDLGVASETNEFGVRYEGFVHLPRNGEYVFYVGSDDGSRLFVDGKDIANADGEHPFGWGSGSVTLPAGPHADR